MLSKRLAHALFALFALFVLSMPARAFGYPYPLPSPSPSLCSWHVVASPSTTNNGNELLSVNAFSSSDAWAVGQSSDNFSGDYFPLVEHWNGATWSIVNSPQPLNTYVSGVREIAPNDIWAVGGEQNQSTFVDNTFAEHWNGSTWTVIPTPNVGSQSNDLLTITESSTNDVWAVGDYFSTTAGKYQTLTEHWNGSTWSIVSSPDVSGVDNMLLGSGAVRSADTWVAGHSDGSQNLIEHWNGSNWSIVASPDSGAFDELRTFASISRTDDWTFGDYQNGSVLATLAMNWNGSTWSIVPTPTISGVNTDIWGSAAVSPTDVWAVGFQENPDRTFTMNWNGSTWTVVPSPNVRSYANDLFDAGRIPGTMNVWAVGRSGRAHFTFKTLIMKFHC